MFLKEAISSGDKLIQNPNAELRPISEELNDGFLNSVSQIFNPEKGEELSAVVVTDHIDVIGYYPRWMTPVGKKQLENQKLMHMGILHSGSGFSNDEFFKLYSTVSSVILQA